MKIYFGNSQTPVDGDGVYHVSRQETLFSDYFKLGSASACEYIFEFDKSLGYDGEAIRVYDDTNALIATVNPMEIEDSAENVVKVTAYDNMVKFDFPYDASSLIGNPESGEQEEEEPEEQSDLTPATLLEVLEDMCTQAGVVLQTEHLYMNDGTTDLATMMIDWYDSTYTARQYIGMVAEMYGGYAYITADGKLDFALFDVDNADSPEIPIDDCSSFDLGDFHEITRVYWGESHYYPLDYSDGDDVIVDMNNMFLTDCVLEDETELTLDDLLENIYDRVGGLQFYSIKVDDLPIPEVRAGSVVDFVDENQVYYPTIWSVKQEYSGQWVGGLEAKFGVAKQGELQAYNTMIQNIKSIKTLVDRANASLTILAREVGSDSDTVAQLQVIVGEINSTVSGLSDEFEQMISTAITQTMDDITVLINGVQATEDGRWQDLSTYIRFSDDGVTVGKIGENASDIFGVFGHDRLSFQKEGGEEKAWLDADDGLGASKVSIGNPDDAYRSQRWQIVASADGDHLRFTRHS